MSETSNLPAVAAVPALPAAPMAESIAVATRVRAEIEARHLVAMQRPRDIEIARQNLLRACRRPLFAAGARYEKRIGDSNVTGPSIRFAEEAIRAFGNIHVSVTVLLDEPEQRWVRVSCTDLERTTTYESDICLQKAVERRRVREGQRVLGERLNSNGFKVFLVPATHDDVQVMQGREVAKVIRQHGLRLIPSDIVEEAMAVCDATRNDEVAKDPDGVRRQVLDAFYKLGVMPAQLAPILHKESVDVLSVAEIEYLRAIYTAMREDGYTLADVEAAAEQAKPQKKGAGDLLKEKLALGRKDGGDGGGANGPA